MKAKYIRHHANYEPPLEYGKSYKVLDVKPEWIMLDLEDGMPFQWWRANCFEFQAEARMAMQNIEQNIAQNTLMPAMTTMAAGIGQSITNNMNSNAMINREELEKRLKESLAKSNFLNYGA